MEESLNHLENVWLSSSKYIVGDNLTIADLFAACEIEQVRLASYNPFEGRPKLSAWYDRVKQETNPFYDEAHVFLNKIVAKNNANQHKNKL